MSSQEELKLSDLQLQSSEANSQPIQWFWQSDPDPWKEKDPTKWIWTPYSYEHTEVIESAFLQNQDVADLGDYEIDLKKMRQVKKTDRNRVRRVKREVNIAVQSRFMLELPPPVPIEKIQQTINPAFGNVQHFLDFIMKRTHETYTLFQKLKELDLDCKQGQYKDVIQAVIQSIQKAAESNEKVTKSRGLSYWKSPIQEAKEIVTEIETKSNNPDLTLRDFLKLVLRAYTMESFVCYWLNELLRSEDWAEINVFTPYLVCLAYTFKIKDYIIPSQEPQGFMEKLTSVFSTQKLTLYRGTALIKEHLRFYHPGNTRMFSWNGVSSTSRSKNQALKFVRMSLKKVKPGEKIGVLFMIETDLDSVVDREGMIDISKDSKFPDEEEVILAPGSVFEVTGFHLDQASNIYEVRLALRKKFKKNHKILGDFQSRIICNRKAILSGLTSEDIIKALTILEGNKLVEGLKIENCVLDSHLMKLIDNVRRTTNIKEENIEALNNQITVDSLMILCHYFSGKNLGRILTQNNVVLKNEIEDINPKSKIYGINEISLDISAINALSDQSLFDQFYKEIINETQIMRINSGLLPSKDHLKTLLTCTPGLQYISLILAANRLGEAKEALKSVSSFKNLQLKFSNPSQVSDQGIEQLKEAFESMNSITDLHLDFRGCNQVSEHGIEKLKDALKPLSSLTHLHLDFGECRTNSDKGINSLKVALKSLTSLTHLYLDFNGWWQVTDEGMDKLKDALMSLTLLTYLHLDFQGWGQLSDKRIDKGIDKLKEGLKSLTSLTHLHLSFKWCTEISNEGIDKLKDALKSLTSLAHLHLNFRECKKVSDEGIGKLKDGLKSLTSLTHLHLDFYACEKISDEGIDKLKDALRSLTPLAHLHLDFHNCKQISDKGIDKLKDGLKPLTSLTHLHLDFGIFEGEITDVGMDKLKDALKSLTSLTHLHLEFGYSQEKITNEGIDKLKDGLKSLTSLTHLHLDFQSCRKISDKGIEKLKVALKSLTSLTHLYLDFHGTKISNKGIDKLKDALKSLVSLTHLHLDFMFCNGISNEGMDRLKDALKSLISLVHLYLAFEECEQISDQGIDRLKDALKSLTSLTNLHLNFKRCKQISDEGIDKLKDALRSLTPLALLHLDFRECTKISDEGIYNLKDALKSLISLNHLNLEFDYCEQISDVGIDRLKDGLKLLTSLTHLNLDFQSCKNISDKAIDTLKDALKSIPNLNIRHYKPFF